jgi:enamine deaminase RidA (YjgF/YER057c/UK114 family)
MPERIGARLKQIGIPLPGLSHPGGNYLPARTVGQTVYIADVIPIHAGEVITGTAGAGRHARTAIGVAALPRNALVDLQKTVEV